MSTPSSLCMSTPYSLGFLQMSSEVLMEVGDLVSTAQEALVDTLSGPSRARLQGEGLAVECSEVSMVEEVISDHVPETGTEVSISSDPAPTAESGPAHPEAEDPQKRESGSAATQVHRRYDVFVRKS